MDKNWQGTQVCDADTAIQRKSGGQTRHQIHQGRTACQQDGSRKRLNVVFDLTNFVTSEVIFFEKYLRKKSFIPIQATIRNNIYEILTILLET